jgi:selenoprotein W-related protein
VSLADELLREFEHTVDRLVLVPSDGGRFEVSVNGELLYSKLQTRRHAEPGEVMGLVRRMVEA